MNISLFAARVVFIFFIATLGSCGPREEYYSTGYFRKVPKIDAHFHYLTFDTRYMKFASDNNFRLLCPNWDGEYSIDDQMKISVSVKHDFPDKFAFFGTFSVDSFGSPDFAEKTISRIKDCMKSGASGIKIWKNIGMVLKDHNGRYVMIDDPAFVPVFSYLEEHRIPVMGHLGEPRDCWLPENEMIDPGAVSYFKANPQYYMYLHPEAPSYDAQIDSRDRVLEKYPELDFIGAHLASLEWSVDKLGEHLEKFPNLKADMAARMYPIQYQSNKDREKVRNFMIKYQDRILYGTDFSVYDKAGQSSDDIMKNLYKGWLDQWIFLATDSTISVKGLKLPKEVIDKIYYKNAEQFFQ